MGIDFDPIKKMREWLLENAIANETELREIEEKAKKEVVDAKNAAWKAYITPYIKSTERTSRAL